MKSRYSTREAAKIIGVALITLQKHVVKETFPVPPLVKVGRVTAWLWNEDDIARARKALAGIQPGRKKRGP